MAVTHISEAEAARDLPGVLSRVSAGENVQIDKESESFVIVSIRKDEPRLLSEIIAGLKENASRATLDDHWGKDLEEIVRLHEQDSLRNPWE